MHIQTTGMASSFIVYTCRSCAYRDVIGPHMSCDLTWLLHTPLNPLSIGQMVNNHSPSTNHFTYFTCMYNYTLKCWGSIEHAISCKEMLHSIALWELACFWESCMIENPAWCLIWGPIWFVTENHNIVANSAFCRKSIIWYASIIIYMYH